MMIVHTYEERDARIACPSSSSSSFFFFSFFYLFIFLYFFQLLPRSFTCSYIYTCVWVETQDPATSCRLAYTPVHPLSRPQSSHISISPLSILQIVHNIHGSLTHARIYVLPWATLLTTRYRYKSRVIHAGTRVFILQLSAHII